MAKPTTKQLIVELAKRTKTDPNKIVKVIKENQDDISFKVQGWQKRVIINGDRAGTIFDLTIAPANFVKRFPQLFRKGKLFRRGEPIQRYGGNYDDYFGDSVWAGLFDSEKGSC